MGIVSYAQNFEDVMLWRAVGHIERGFYIDVGAQDPVVDSVSKAFYDHGWRGIHVEASPVFANRVREARPDEIVVQAALGNRRGMMAFHEIRDTGLSTGDAAIAEHHRSTGREVREIQVPCLTLADVFGQAGDREVHWLKIDVEGMEAEVLAGWGESAVRPWVVVVESTYPNSQVSTHQGWEPGLLALGYTYAYFDGLSRYYAAVNRPELAKRLRMPPNCFDGFTLAESTPFSAGVRELLHRKQEQLEQETATIRLAHSRELEVQQSESRKLAGTLAETERRATAQMLDSQREAAARERALQDQLQGARQDVQELLRTLAQREQALGEALRANMAQAAQEQAALVDAHEAKELELTRRLAALEKESTAQRLDEGRRQERLRAELIRTHADQMRAALADAADRREKVEHEKHAAQEAAVQRLDELSRHHAAQHGDLVRVLEVERASAGRARADMVEAQQRVQGLRESLMTTQKALEFLGADQVESLMRIPGFAIRRPGDMHGVAESMEALLALHGRLFVECAYRTLLGRAPDPEGLAYYVGRLNAGVAKSRLVAQIHLCPEGAARGARLPGLEAVVRRERMFRMPLIGPLLSRFQPKPANEDDRRLHRETQDLLHSIAGEIQRRLEEFQPKPLAHLQEPPPQQPAMQHSPVQAVAVSHAPTTEPAVKVIDQPELVNALSPAVRKIFLQLASIGSADTRIA